MTQKTLIENLEALPRTHIYNHDRQDGGDEAVCAYVKVSDIRAIIKAAPEVSSQPVTLLSAINADLQKRIGILEDLLSSAYNIANRKGTDTHWFRFASQLHVNGISPVTAKTFKILPSDQEYTTPPDQSARIAELEAQRDRLLSLIKNDAHAISFQSLAQYRSAIIKEIEASR